MLPVLLFSLLIIFLNYTYLVLSFLKGWNHLTGHTKNGSSNTYISIIIPFRNEENNLGSLLNRLKNQTYPRNLFEILFVNDHSSDKSAYIIYQNLGKTQASKLIHLEEGETGKKDAIRKGILNSNGELLVTLDADCLPGLDWLTTIENYYHQHNPDMIIAPVLMHPGDTFLTRLFSLEFTSLLASTAGAAGNNKPIMCNGANLGIKKTAINKLPSVYQHPSASGDDIFLLEAMKSEGKSIHFCKYTEASVYTDAPKTLAEFINQRIRWASKSKRYKDFRLKYVAISIFLINVSLFGLLIGTLINHEFLYCYLTVLVLKSIVDLTLLAPVIKHFNVHSVFKARYVILVELLYPFYSLLVAVLSQAIGYKWKDRKHYE
jgi:cellulose synthase/poly-beta-1,6-N-acetylglucosamine synthase-like glycosyltransferase